MIIRRLLHIPLLAFYAFCLLLLGACTSSIEDVETQKIAEQIAGHINAEFADIKAQVPELAAACKAMYLPTATYHTDAPLQYAMHSNGTYYKAKKDDGAALWISGATPIDTSLMELAWRSEVMDNALIQIVENNPAVIQSYYNSKESLNRIFPPFDVIAQYEPGMNIPEFNFYYLADSDHNPERETVWVPEPYVDPAGRGWMVSALAPVYLNDTLMGVAGVDITSNAIAERWIHSSKHKMLLISNDATVIAGTPELLNKFGLPSAAPHRYLETVKRDITRLTDYSLLHHTDRNVRSFIQDAMNKQTAKATLLLGGAEITLHTAPVKELNWVLIVAE